MSCRAITPVIFTAAPFGCELIIVGPCSGRGFVPCIILAGSIEAWKQLSLPARATSQTAGKSASTGHPRCQSSKPHLEQTSQRQLEPADSPGLSAPSSVVPKETKLGDVEGFTEPLQTTLMRHQSEHTSISCRQRLRKASPRSQLFSTNPRPCCWTSFCEHRLGSKGKTPAPLLASLTEFLSPAAPGDLWVRKDVDPRRMVQTSTPSPLPALAPAAAAAVTSTADSGGASEQEVALRRLTHLQQLYRIYKVRRYHLLSSSCSSRG